MRTQGLNRLSTKEMSAGGHSGTAPEGQYSDQRGDRGPHISGLLAVNHPRPWCLPEGKTFCLEF